MSLRAQSLGFGYRNGAVPVIDGFSLDLAPGERVVLTAPSGGGKTTLCKLLAGYLTPSTGQILVDGQPLPTAGYAPVQMIWQHPQQAVNPRLTLGQSLAEGDGVPPSTIDELGINPAWLERYPAELSGGEIQRLCIARALGSGTRYLIADEITTMLDPISQAIIWRFLIDECTRRQIGLLLVTHDRELANRVATRHAALPAPPERPHRAGRHASGSRSWWIPARSAEAAD